MRLLMLMLLLLLLLLRPLRLLLLLMLLLVLLSLLLWCVVCCVMIVVCVLIVVFCVPCVVCVRMCACVCAVVFLSTAAHGIADLPPAPQIVIERLSYDPSHSVQHPQLQERIALRRVLL